MKIGIIIEPNISPKEIVQLGQLAESYGIDALWTPSHSSARDPFMALTPLAFHSEKIRLGTIALSPFEVHPLKIIHSLFTLNEYSKGRASAVVGVGGGVLNAAGLRPTRRVRALRECIDILRAASEQEMLQYKGEIYQVTTYQPFPWKTFVPPRVYVAGSKDQLVRMSTKQADGVMFSDVTVPMMSGRMEIINEGLAAAGRSREEFHVNNLVALHINEDRDAAVREAREKMWIRGMVEPFYTKDFLDSKDREVVAQNWNSFMHAFKNKTHIVEGVSDRIMDALVKGLTLTGGPDDIDDIVERLQQFRTAGLDEIALRTYSNPAYAIKMIGEHILPMMAP
jgi:alkanesulfonate monooxygenase SsuD/methylene tetrahydromethanopterin reductase-like flavin-dependent oxidoreductase (luciferase family)